MHLKERSLDCGLTQTFDHQQSAIAQPITELLSGEQFKMPCHGLDAFQDYWDHATDIGSLGYDP